MAQSTWIQDKFSYGEISPKAASKPNSDFYYSALAEATNTLILPQSILTRRFGLKRIGEVPTAAVASEIKYYNFQIGAFSNYLMVVAPNLVYIYYEDFLCATIPNPYPRDVTSELKFIQENGMPTFLNNNYQTKQIQRSLSDYIQILSINTTLNTLSTAGLGMALGQVLPVLFSVGPTQPTSLPVTRPQINTTRVYFIRAINATDFAIYNTPQEASANVNRYSIIETGETASVNPLNTWNFVEFEFFNRPTFDFSGNYSANTFTYNVGASTFSVDGDGFFTEEYVNGIIQTPGQILRITEFQSGTLLTVDFVDGFNNANESPYIWGGTDILITIPAFSDLRGWPGTGGFFQGRCVLANTSSLSNYIAFSVVSNSHDFDDLGIYTSDGLSSLVNSDKGSLIFYVFSSKTLIIFTAGGIFSTPYSGTAPISSNSFRIDPETEEFVEDIQPVWLDNNLFYVAGGGSVIKSMKFDISINSYNLIDTSDYSSHLIRNPITLATYKNSDTSDVNLLFVINNDGTVACHNSLTEQKIHGWTPLVTKDGLFRYADGARGNCYFLVQRGTQDEPIFSIEKTDFTRFLDCSVALQFDTPTNQLNDLPFMEGQEVQVIADGYRLGSFIVQNNSLTLSAAYSVFEVGINVEISIKTLPFTVPDSGTFYFYHPKIYTSVFVDYYQSYQVYVNGDLIPMLSFDDSTIDAPPVPQTGFYETIVRMDPMEYIGVHITQVDPYPFTLRAIGYEVKK